MNKVILSGNICNELEIKETGESKILSFNIAVRRNFKNKNAEYESDFFRVTAFNNQAKFIKDYFSKGSKILIEGRMQNRNWEDENGQKHYSNDIIINQIEFCGSKRDNSEINTVNNFEDNTSTSVTDNKIDDDPLPF